MKHVWLCESCLATHDERCSMWDCPGCEKEVCDSCFDRYLHCKTCASGKTDQELAEIVGMEEDA